MKEAQALLPIPKELLRGSKAKLENLIAFQGSGNWLAGDGIEDVQVKWVVVNLIHAEILASDELAVES